MNPLTQFDIRRATPDDAAALFVVHAAIVPTDAGQMLDWTGELEERLETGGRGWVVARGRRVAGYALIDPVPGLPGVYDLTGGIVPARRRQGLGTQLLRHVRRVAGEGGVRIVSCRVNRLEDEEARFLLRRDYYMEHEECLLEWADPAGLPPVPSEPQSALLSYPAEHAIGEFCRVYNASFAGRPWSQPYTEAEVAAMLTDPEDLLFAIVDGVTVGIVWHEVLPDGRGRVEPLGIITAYQGRGHGRRLLVAAMHRLRERGARLVEIGVWRDNIAALSLYKSLGFMEIDHWYFLASDTTAGSED